MLLMVSLSQTRMITKTSTSNQATQNLQPENIEPSLYETEINKMDLGLKIAKLSQHIEELYIKFNLILAAIAQMEFSIDELEQIWTE